MKQWFSVAAMSVALFFFPKPSTAQLTNGAINAGFGIDADTRSNFVKYGPSTGAIFNDDWFSPLLSGNNVIDTTNAAFYLSSLQSGNNLSFSKRMSALIYAKIGGKLWLDAAYGRDYIAAASLKDSTTFASACKNGDNPANWNGGISNFPTKNDLVDVYAHMRRDGVSVYDSLWFFTGVSSFGTTGSSYYDVELYKNSFSYNPAAGTFTSAGTSAGHTEWLFDASGNLTQTGDLIVAVNFSPGSAPIVDLRIWVSKTTLSTVIPTRFNFTGAYDGATASPAYGYASIVSKSGSTAWGSGISNYSSNAAQDTTYATPWGTAAATGSGNWSSQYLSQQFIEVGLNLSRIGVDPSLYSKLNPCQSLFANIFFKSRSSNSFTSNMQDFVVPLVFLRPALMDYSIQPDTLRCNHTAGVIHLTNNSTMGYYTWKTANGTISGSNGDSSVINITKAGTYIVSSSPAQGCPTSRTDTIVVPIDTFPPVASVNVSLVGGVNSPSAYFQLYGGNTSASNYSTPFGGSQGLLWAWTGPNAFTAAIQNPRTAGPYWGTYNLTVTEKRNGCTASASQNVTPSLFTTLEHNDLFLQGSYTSSGIQLTWREEAENPPAYYLIQKFGSDDSFTTIGTAALSGSGQMAAAYSFADSHPASGDNTYRVAAVSADGSLTYSGILTIGADRSDLHSIYLTGNAPGSVASIVAQVAKQAKGTVVVYDLPGQLVSKKEVTLAPGVNILPLPSDHLKGIRIVALFINDRLSFSQKVLY